MLWGNSGSFCDRGGRPRLYLSDGEAIVGFEGLSEIIPAADGLEIKDVEVESDDLRVMLGQEIGDGLLEFFLFEGFGKASFDLALAIVRDFHAITEVLEDVLLAVHEPDLEEVFADGFAGAEFEGFVDEGDLVWDGLLFDEDGAKLTVGSEGGDGLLVELSFFSAEPGEHIGDDGGVDFLVDLEGFHD